MLKTGGNSFPVLPSLLTQPKNKVCRRLKGQRQGQTPGLTCDLDALKKTFAFGGNIFKANLDEV